MAVPLSNLSTTWATSAGTVNTAIKMNVTDTASAAASKLIDLQINDVSKFSVSKAGVVTATGYNGINLSAYVLKAGDTMTGNLVMSSADVAISGSGQFKADTDGASAPGYSWGGAQSGTGMYNAAGNVAFSISGSYIARYTASEFLVGETTMWATNTPNRSGCALLNTGVGYFYTGSATTTPLEVSRGGAASSSGTLINFYTNGTAKGSISSNAGYVLYNTSSDYRLKENFTDIVDPVKRLMKLRPLKFNFIENPEASVDGFLAHEVQKVVPESVTGIKDELDAEGNPVYQSMDQSKIIPLITAALQETIKELEKLKLDFEEYKLKHP